MYTTFLGFVQVQPYNALYGSLSDLHFGLGRVCVFNRECFKKFSFIFCILELIFS